METRKKIKELKTTEFVVSELNNKVLIAFSSNTSKDDVIHKLNRICSELEFVKDYNDKFISLTKRERQIISFVVSGKNNIEISNELFISRQTVEQHRKNINRKLNLHTLSHLCAFAYAYNLV